MHVLTNEETRRWCQAQPLSMNVDPNGFLRYKTDSLFGFYIGIPPEALSIVCLAQNLMRFEDEQSFFGGFLWLANWDTGPVPIERSGLRMIEQMRRGYGITSSIENAPGHMFRTDEAVDLDVFLTLPMIFHWEAFYIPKASRYFAYLHGNDFLYFVAEKEELYERLLAHFKNWNPSIGFPPYLNKTTSGRTGAPDS